MFNNLKNIGKVHSLEYTLRHVTGDDVSRVITATMESKATMVTKVIVAKCDPRSLLQQCRQFILATMWAKVIVTVG
jgi:hypothetical protein